MNATKMFFEAHKVDLFRSNKLIFENLNLKIHDNESIAILGPNGSGKTTLIKTINREIYPATKEGSYLKIYGKRTWNVWQLRSMIGIVSDDLIQSYNQDVIGVEVVLSGYHASVGVHGQIQRRLKTDQIDKAKEIMQKLDISSLENQPLKKLSMGQRKRCLLARALVHNPKIILLDEPTTGLDLSSTYKYMDILAGLKKDGHNIILVTHNIHEINNVIERVIMLKKGKIVADGKKDEILTEENLTNAFDVAVGLKKIDENILPYKKTIRQ